MKRLFCLALMAGLVWWGMLHFYRFDMTRSDHWAFVGRMMDGWWNGGRGLRPDFFLALVTGLVAIIMAGCWGNKLPSPSLPSFAITNTLAKNIFVHLLAGMRLTIKVILVWPIIYLSRAIIYILMLLVRIISKNQPIKLPGNAELNFSTLNFSAGAPIRIGPIQISYGSNHSDQTARSFTTPPPPVSNTPPKLARLSWSEATDILFGGTTSEESGAEAKGNVASIEEHTDSPSFHGFAVERGEITVEEMQSMLIKWLQNSPIADVVAFEPNQCFEVPNFTGDNFDNNPIGFAPLLVLTNQEIYLCWFISLHGKEWQSCPFDENGHGIPTWISTNGETIPCPISTAIRTKTRFMTQFYEETSLEIVCLIFTSSEDGGDITNINDNIKNWTESGALFADMNKPDTNEWAFAATLHNDDKTPYNQELFNTILQNTKDIEHRHRP